MAPSHFAGNAKRYLGVLTPRFILFSIFLHSQVTAWFLLAIAIVICLLLQTAPSSQDAAVATKRTPIFSAAHDVG